MVATTRKSKPPFRAEHIGSLLRPPRLIEARDAFEAGRLKRPALAEVEDAAIRDVVAYQALQDGKTDEVRRLFLGPEIRNFQRAAAAAEDLATLEAARAAKTEDAFEDAQNDALRLLILASIIAAVLVALLLVTAFDLARAAERTLAATPPPDEPAV